MSTVDLLLTLTVCACGLMVGLGLGASVPAAEARGAGKAWFEARSLDTGFPNQSALPNVARSQDGTIFCAFAVNIQSIYLTSTRDAGSTWSKPAKVMECPRAGYIADPNLLVVGHRVTVFATFVPAPSPPFAHSETLAATSEDGGRTWTKPTLLPISHKYVCGKTHVPVWLDERTVAMGYSYDLPAEEGRPGSTEGEMDLRAGVLLSHDAGTTWTPGGDVHVNVFPIGADEPALVQLRNGDLFMVVRTASPRPYETRSRDGGRTWEEPKPSRFYGRNSPTALLRLKDGSILRVWDNSPTNRFPLVASISTDECRTWSPPRTITEPKVDDNGQLSFVTACYPSIAQADDGTIVVVWWETSGGGSNIGLARFKRSWVEEAKRSRQAKTVVAFGDSVTLGVRPGVNEYQTFRHLLERRLREGGVNVRVLNAAIGGSNTRDGLARMEHDVLAERPALVLVMFGINDAAMVDGGPVARKDPRVPLEEYCTNLAEMVRRAKAAKAKVVLCTPTPMTRAYVYADLGEYGKHEDINYMLSKYAEAVREVAKQRRVPLVDLFDLFTRAPDRLSLIKDGNHPWPKGHALIADALFEPVRKALSAK